MSQQKEIGTLVVVVLKAQHLHQPSFYKQDPYAQATLSGLKRRTKVAPKGGQHPVWDDELRFPVLADDGKDKANRILEIACYKDEQRGEDVLLGKGTVDIEETLKTGEFDDWIPLETSAGARGEVYLEMTFYANSAPPLTRRPSKLSPSDRLVVRPTQSQQSIPKTSPVASTHPGRSPITADRKPLPTSGSQIPASLIPARGGKKQLPPNVGASPAATTFKHKEASLPPLPIDDALDVGSGKNPGLPTTLHPGGRGGPRPIPPHNQNRTTSMGRPPPEILPEQLHRRTLSDTPALHVSSFPQQSYSSATTAVTGVNVGSTPSILVEEHLPPLRFPTPLTSTPGPAHSSMQANSQAYIPAPTQGYPQTLSPFPPPMPPQSPYIPSGQPQQYYNASPPGSPLPSHYQQYTQYPSRPMTSQSLPPPQTYPQHHSTQPQQQPSHSLQPQPHPPCGLPSQQQQYLSQPQQQYQQHLPYAQIPHPPQVPQPYQQHNHAVLPLSNQSAVASQQSYSQPQPQPSILVPPPPPIQTQARTPTAYPQASHQPKPYFSPPPPPPPLLYSQGGSGPSIPPSVAQPSQAPIPPPPPSQELVSPSTSLQQSVSLVAPLSQPSAPPLPARVVSDAAPAAGTDVVGQSRVEEGPNETGLVVFAETTAVVHETREPPGANQTTEVQNKDVIVEEQGQQDALKNVKDEGAGEERDSARRTEESEGEPRRLEEAKRQEEERIWQQEEARKRHEQEEREKQEEARKEQERREREEEERRREEERLEKEKRRREEELRNEERRKREEELVRKEEELRKKEEELKRREEEEERRRRQEEERRRQEEEERRMRAEEERRRQEEERVRREREEAERRQEEAEARRRQAEEASRKWQEDLARIKARAEQEAADAAFARAQMEEDEAERRRQEEEDLALVRQAQEEEEREERLAQERRRQEEADREVARREQAHEEELERRRQGERRKRMEKADRELAKQLEMELNLSS